MSRLGRSQPVQPAAWHGFVDPGPGPVGTTPPPPVTVDRVDQRARYLPLPPVVLVGVLDSGVGVPGTSPPAAFVVPVEERRRFLAAIPPDIQIGFDNVAPAKTVVVEPDTRRRLPGDPFLINSGLLAATVAAAPGATPPKLIVVELDDQRRRRLSFDSFFAASGLYASTVPPPVATATPLRALLGVGI